MALAVSVATFPAATPPMSTVTVTGLTGTVGNTWSLYRLLDGQSVPVRGVESAPVLGPDEIRDDAECPFGVPVGYLAVEYTAAGATVDQAQSSSVVLDVTVPWISDPLSPSVACPVVLGGEALSQLGYPQDRDLVLPVGASLPVGVVRSRQSAAGIPLPILCLTVGARIAALAVLQSAAAVCLRTPGTTPYSMLPRLAYVVGDVTESPLDVPIGGTATRLDWTGTLVRPPAGGVVVSTRTYGDLLAEASSYGDLPVQHSTYLALLRGTA